MRPALTLLLTFAALSQATSASADSLVWTVQSGACAQRPPSPSCDFALWRSDADGGKAQVVGGGQGDVLWPQWSRTGQRIVFHRQVDDTPETIDAVGRYEVFSMAGDGTDVRRLTDGGETLDMQPAVSPDGRDVAWWRSGFDSSLGFEVGGIWLMAADGSDQRRIVDLPGNESTPDFTADGRRIAFTRDLRGPGVDVATVWSVTRDGGDLRQLSTGSLAARLPKFSPDGRHLAFLSGNAVVVMALDGSATRSYALGAHNAAWSSDGRFLAVLGAPPGPDGQSSLWRIDMSRPAEPPQLVRDLRAEAGGWLAHPGWVTDATSSSAPDRTGPSFVVGLAEPGSGGPVEGSLRVVGGRRAQRSLTVRDATRLHFAAADRSGLKQVEAAIGLRGTKPRFRRVYRHTDWRRLTRGLRRGTYVLRVQTRDARGNVRRAGRALTLRVAGK